MDKRFLLRWIPSRTLERLRWKQMWLFKRPLRIMVQSSASICLDFCACFDCRHYTGHRSTSCRACERIYCIDTFVLCRWLHGASIDHFWCRKVVFQLEQPFRLWLDLYYWLGWNIGCNNCCYFRILCREMLNWDTVWVNLGTESFVKSSSPASIESISERIFRILMIVHALNIMLTSIFEGWNVNVAKISVFLDGLRNCFE